MIELTMRGHAQTGKTSEALRIALGRPGLTLYVCRDADQAHWMRRTRSPRPLPDNFVFTSAHVFMDMDVRATTIVLEDLEGFPRGRDIRHRAIDALSPVPFSMLLVVYP